MKKISLAYLTVPELSPLEAVHVAADAGYTHVGLRLLPAMDGEPLYPLLTNFKLLRQVRAAMDKTGIQVGDLEMIRLKPAMGMHDFNRFFECAQALNAKDVVVVSDDDDLSRMTDNFSALCQQARSYGLYLNLEPIPWTALNRFENALEVLEAAGQPNAGLLIDAFHLHRCGASLSILETLNSELIRVFQICDAPVDYFRDKAAIRNEARTARLLPGHGELALSDLLMHIPPSAICSIEVPNNWLMRQYTPAERAAMALSATKRLLVI